MGKQLPIRRSPRSQAAVEDLDPELQQQLAARQQREKKERRLKRPRATYDLPLEIIEAITEISHEESVPRSGLAAWALAEFVIRYHAGEIDLEPYKEESDSLRYEWTLNLPEELSFAMAAFSMSP